MKYWSLVVISSLISLTACKEDAKPPQPAPAPKPVEAPPPPKPDTLTFSAFAMNGFSSLKKLDDELGAEKMLLLMKLNRLDRDHIRDNDTLVMPSVFDDRLSPYPADVAAAHDIPKLIVVSRRIQAFAAYEAGKLMRWGPTSTGKKKTPTPDGLYAANWRKDTAISTVDPSWVLPWCVNIHNLEGISFHQFDLPGYPASHSCIRLLAVDAEWIFNWVETWRLTKDAREIRAFGTPVIIFEDYPFGSAFQRKRIIRNRNAHYVSPASLDSIIAVHKPVIAERQLQRDAVLADTVAKPVL